jgi:hypothetical protein
MASMDEQHDETCSGLHVAIYRDGILIRIECLPDPRIEYVEQYNERHGGDGMHAAIVSDNGRPA